MTNKATTLTVDQPVIAGRVGSRLWSLHLFTLCVAAVILLWSNRDQWFFGDEWDFILHRPLSGGLSTLFQPHNEHWSTLPILEYRALLTVFGLRTYVPYIAVLLLVHLGLTHLLWRISLRAGARAGIATAVAAIFACYGAGAENLLWAFQIGFIGSLFFGWLGAHLATREASLRRLVGVWILVILGLMCSGIGLVMLGVIGLAVLLKHGVRRALAAVAVPFASFVIWYLLVGRHAHAQAPRTVTTYLSIADYVWSGLSHAFEASVGLPGVGALIVILLAAWLVSTRMISGSRAAAVAGLVGVAVLFLLLGYGRSGLGVAESSASRYVYLTGALAFPAVCLALTDVRAHWPQRQFVFVALALLVLTLWHNLALLHTTYVSDAQRESEIKQEVLAAANLIRSGAPVFEKQVEPRYDPDIGTAGLREAVHRHWLPRGTGITEASLLTARTHLQTDLAAASEVTTESGIITAYHALDLQWRPDGCVSLVPIGDGPAFQIGATKGSVSIDLHVESAEKVQVFLGDSATGTVAQYPAVYNLPASRDMALVNLAAGTNMTVTLSSSVVLCHVARSGT